MICEECGAEQELENAAWEAGELLCPGCIEKYIGRGEEA